MPTYNDEVSYSVEKSVGIDEVRRLWLSSGFIEYVPDFDWNTLPRMLENSNLIVVARQDGKLVGMTRSVTDFTLYCGLVDIMVDREYQRQGIAANWQSVQERQPDATSGLPLWPQMLLVSFTNKPALLALKMGGQVGS